MTISIKSEIDRNARPRVFRNGGRTHYKVNICLSATSPAQLDQIRSVRYKLHESFKDPTRMSSDRNSDFMIDVWTYGYFGISAEIELQNGSTNTIQGKVTFNVSDAPTEIDNPFEQLRSAKQKLQSLRR